MAFFQTGAAGTRPYSAKSNRLSCTAGNQPENDFSFREKTNPPHATRNPCAPDCSSAYPDTAEATIDQIGGTHIGDDRAPRQTRRPVHFMYDERVAGEHRGNNVGAGTSPLIARAQLALHSNAHTDPTRFDPALRDAPIDRTKALSSKRSRIQQNAHEHSVQVTFKGGGSPAHRYALEHTIAAHT